MRAALFKEIGKPLEIVNIARPKCSDDEICIAIDACGICRTDLHIFDGEVKAPHLPLILGHEIIGKVVEVGAKVQKFQKGDRAGVAWLAKTCGHCEFCKTGRENLCDYAEFTGLHRPGGYAEYTTCLADFAIPLNALEDRIDIAPLLCAGLIGYRSYKKVNDAKIIGFYGFGAAASLLMQLANYEKKKVYAFTRKGDIEAQTFAKKQGAIWAGDSLQSPPEKLDAAIIFAPVGELVPISLKALKKGGKCICGGIHMTDIPTFPYKDLWGERSIESVANMTRQDAKEFFTKVQEASIMPSVTLYPLEKVNEAFHDIKTGKISGPAVLMISKSTTDS